MRVLIMGGTAFMGPFVVRNLLKAGHSVTVLHRGQTAGDLPPEVEHMYSPGLAFDDRHELTGLRETFQRLAPEVVVDMILMTEAAARTTLDTFRGIAGRIVMASSQDVYAAYGRMLGLETGPADETPAREDSALRQHRYPYRGSQPRAADDPRRWQDDYDKIPVEQIVLGDPELPGTVLRLPMVYGPGDKQHRLFELVKRMDDGRPYILLDESLAAWRGARGYVEDMAHAITLAVTNERAAGRVYNVVEPELLTELEWEQAIGRAAGWPGKIIKLPGEALPEFLRADFDAAHHLATDSTRIRAELGYTETLSRADALRRTIAWERANPPKTINPAQFDYAVEDAALAAWRVR